MLSRIFKWLKRFFKQLFNQLFNQGKKTKTKKEKVEEKELTDTDYEFLFMQLLEGVSHGWHQGQIVKFFERLETRANRAQWIAWLKRFQAKILNSNAPNQELASRMVYFSQVTESIPNLENFSNTVYKIGNQILSKITSNPIWEYSGVDSNSPNYINSTHSTNAVSLEKNTKPTTDSNSPQPQGQPQGEVIRIDELLVKLQEDANLVTQMAQQLGIETTDPSKIIETLINQLNTVNNQTTDVQEYSSPVEAWFNTGLNMARAGDLAGAISSWDKVLELNPNFSQAWHNRGSALANLGKLDDAIASFDQAIAINPNDHLAWNNRGNVFYNLQNWEEALSCWNHVVEIQPEYYQSWYNRGCALENLNKKEESLKSYEKALKIKPDFQPALKRRKRLLENLNQQNSN